MPSPCLSRERERGNLAFGVRLILRPRRVERVELEARGDDRLDRREFASCRHRNAARCRPAARGRCRRASACRLRRTDPSTDVRAMSSSKLWKPSLDPVPDPAMARGLVGAEFLFEKAHHARVVERMDVAGDDHRERAHARAVARGGRQQFHLAVVGLVEVFDDRDAIAGSRDVRRRAPARAPAD